MVDFQPLEGMSKAESGGVAAFLPSTFSNVSSREYPFPRLPGMMRMSSVCLASLAAWSRMAFEVSRSVASGTVRGKDSLRAYWSKALAIIPNLHFTLIDTYASPDSVAVLYDNERGNRICEYLRLDDAGKIRQGSANHLVR